MSTPVGQSSADVEAVTRVARDIATVMVRSEPFVEYLHLARFGDRRLIVNALYYVLV